MTAVKTCQICWNRRATGALALRWEGEGSLEADTCTECRENVINMTLVEIRTLPAWRPYKHKRHTYEKRSIEELLGEGG